MRIFLDIQRHERVICSVSIKLERTTTLFTHPEHQNKGLGTELNKFALRKFKECGMKLASLGTGGDEGHAPARRSYEKAGYTALPLVRYYKKL